MLVRRIARPLLSSAFVADGVRDIREASGRAEQLAPLIETVEQQVPTEVSALWGANPETLVRVNAAVQIGAGLSLAFGKAPRLSALALAGSFVPAAVGSNAFWQEQDPAIRKAKRSALLKNVSQLGGLMIAAVDTEGKPSLAWRGRRAARRVASATADVIPIGSESTAVGEKLAEGAHQAAERGKEFGDAARERGAHALQVARDRGPEIVAKAREGGAELAEVVRTRGGELVESAKDAGLTTQVTRRKRPRFGLKAMRAS